jgi:hypothetical protein
LIDVIQKCAGLVGIAEVFFDDVPGYMAGQVRSVAGLTSLPRLMGFLSQTLYDLTQATGIAQQPHQHVVRDPLALPAMKE